MKLVEKKDYSRLFYFVALFIFFSFIVVTISGEEGLLRLIQLKSLKENLIHQNKTLLQENLYYRKKIKSLHHLASIEKQAKKSLGLVHENEIVFILEKQN